ncbi:hypothetical protein BU15DRAFT_80158 [Melanogaster broomeanus]|nr:hypothetical protein BU15DRAFT_80158 [Melanogaster broomeanus]
MQYPALVIPNVNGGIGESPTPVQRSPVSPVRPKRVSRLAFFAFSSSRKPSHGPPIIQLPQSQQENLPDSSTYGSTPGGWRSDKVLRSEAHLADPTSVPPALRTDEEDYYYSYYSSLTPTDPLSRSTSLHIDSTKNHSPSQARLNNSHPTHIHHRKVNTHELLLNPNLRNLYDKLLPSDFSITQQGSHTDTNSSPAPITMLGSTASSQVKWEASETQLRVPQAQLRTSASAPNLASSAPLSPTPMKKNAGPVTRTNGELAISRNMYPGVGRHTQSHQSTPMEPNRIVGASSTPALTGRPRAVSAASNPGRARTALTKSRSATDLFEKLSTFALPRSGFVPALETLVDEPTPTESVAEQVSSGEPELSLPDQPPSLTQVIEDGEALQRQRDRWRLEASKSLGNKHTRSLSRARSKSVSDNYARGRRKSESSKSQSHLEFLAARTLLGSQSVMPKVHVSKPSSTSSHSNPYSHSHSQSALSHTHSHTYSHSHSHSLTTSNSSKSSRHPHHRGHSRNESWGTTALLKASILCGVSQNDSRTAEVKEKAPLSSRVDGLPNVYPGDPEGALDGTHVNCGVSPGGQVGIAISSLPPEGDVFPNPDMDNLSVPDHPSDIKAHAQIFRVSQDHIRRRWIRNYPRMSPPVTSALRHRLPPRATAHRSAIPHPYGPAIAPMGEQAGRGGQGDTLQVPGAGASGSSAGRGFNPHISLNSANFEQYGVGEALVYASRPRSEEIIRPKEGDVQEVLSPEVEPGPRVDKGKAREQSPSRATVVWPLVERFSDSPELISNNPSSVSVPTAHMMLSGFDTSGDLDEFQDLFYKPPPRSSSGYQTQESSVISKQIPSDIHSSESESALTNLVRSLSEEMNELRDLSQAPSDPTSRQKPEGHTDQTETEVGPKYVFLDVARSYSPSTMRTESSAQLRSPAEEEGEPASQLSTDIPEDVVSSRASSVLNGPSEEENDTFGYPVRHGLVEAASPFSIQTPRRASTHLSILDGVEEQDEILSPVPTVRDPVPTTADALRESYMTTTSDYSCTSMSGLSDFPLPPPCARISTLDICPSSKPISKGHRPSHKTTILRHPLKLSFRLVL